MAEVNDMTDKKSFGSFIKSKRIEKNYSQKDLAELLFVSGDAVSKWERGISYPDISLITDICRVLDITEHEFITAANDPAVRKEKTQARLYRRIRGSWLLVPTIGYGIALLVCFIVNLAVSHTLSWFLIVLTSLLTAYSFIPTFSLFFEKRKFLIFAGSSFLSICLLLLTCGAYTHTIFWVPIAVCGLLIGYDLLFLPVILSKTKVTHFKFLISFVGAYFITILLLLIARAHYTFPLGAALTITSYSYAAPICCAVLCLFDYDRVLKSGICAWLVTLFYGLIGFVIKGLFKTNDKPYYSVDFQDWHNHIDGNVNLIILLSFIGIALILTAVGVYRQKKESEEY